MPFSSQGSYGAFSPEDVEILQNAFNLCRARLGHSSATDEELHELARLIIRSFENGERDPEVIARRSFEISKLIPK